MKATTLHELKQELQHLPTKELIELCLRLSKYKKENKELLCYLIFEAHDERDFIAKIKAMIDVEIATIPNDNNPYLIKKSLRKLLRAVTKYVKFTGSKKVEVELLIYYCQCVTNHAIPLHKSAALTNLYEMQLKKLNKVLPSLHPDLQYDYQREIDEL
jgi:hypothetical protein